MLNNTTMNSQKVIQN